MLVGVALLTALLASPPGALAQAHGGAADAERERQFVEALGREDPASAERYVTLRDARSQALAELRRVEEQYSGAGPELRPLLLSRLKQARRQFAESSLALLEFLDARDRRVLALYQEEIRRITGLLEEHTRARAELEKLLQGN